MPTSTLSSTPASQPACFRRQSCHECYKGNHIRASCCGSTSTRYIICTAPPSTYQTCKSRNPTRDNNHLSRWEYMEDAPMAKCRFKRVETAERDKYIGTTEVGFPPIYKVSFHILAFQPGTTEGRHPRRLGRQCQLKGWLLYHP